VVNFGAEFLGKGTWVFGVLHQNMEVVDDLVDMVDDLVDVVGGGW